MGIKLYCVHYEKEGFYADFEAVKKLHKILPKKAPAAATAAAPRAVSIDRVAVATKAIDL